MALNVATDRLNVDHLVYCVPDRLEDAMDTFEALTGVKPVHGGRHLGLGTHNAIVSLGGQAYFEILARDPEQVDPPRTWMAIDAVTAPRLVTWAAARSDLPKLVATARSRGYDPGTAQNFSRTTADGRTLRWSLSYNHYAEPLPGAGIVPFIIEWDPSCSDFVPAKSAPVGCRLLSLRASHEDPVSVLQSLRALGIESDGYLEAEPRVPADGAPRARLIATLLTPNGIVEIS